MKNIWSLEDYVKYEEEHIKKFDEENPNGSPAKPLFVPCGNKEDFESYAFSRDNWNGADVLRDYIYKSFELESCTHEQKFSMVLNDGHYDVASINMFFCINEDARHALIVVSVEGRFDSYDIQWYKHRGRTDSITKNGYPVELEDYIYLLNILNIEK